MIDGNQTYKTKKDRIYPLKIHADGTAYIYFDKKERTINDILLGQSNLLYPQV